MVASHSHGWPLLESSDPTTRLNSHPRVKSTVPVLYDPLTAFTDGVARLGGVSDFDRAKLRERFGAIYRER